MVVQSDVQKPAEVKTVSKFSRVYSPKNPASWMLIKPMSWNASEMVQMTGKITTTMTISSVGEISRSPSSDSCLASVREVTQRCADQGSFTLLEPPALDGLGAGAHRLERLGVVEVGQRRLGVNAGVESFPRGDELLRVVLGALPGGHLALGCDREPVLVSVGHQVLHVLRRRLGGGIRGDDPGDDLAVGGRLVAVRTRHSAHVGSASFRSPAISSRMNDDQTSIAAWPAKYVARVESTSWLPATEKFFARLA